MNQRTDQQLLRDYLERRSEPAFAELVRRYVDFVHSAALRMVRDSHLAEDVTQGVFLALAKSAGQLCARPVLSGWLHGTTRNLAANAVRADVRRRAREQEAAAMNELLSPESDATWDNVAPHLDAALGDLSDDDRDAVLLRYFQSKSAREIGQFFGTTEEAAQKRLSRAVERLREFFAKRGVAVGAGGLIMLVTAHAVQAAPVGLAASISTAVGLTGATIATAATAAAAKTIAMTTLHKTLVAAIIVAAGTAVIYEAHQASDLNTRVQALQKQLPLLTAQIDALDHSRNDATNRLAALLAENEFLRRNSAELPRLRAEVTRLRSELMAASEKGLNESEAQSWLARVSELKKRLEQMPGQKIPELDLLKEKNWLDVARDANTNNDAGIRDAFGKLRRAAKNDFAPTLSSALRNYVRAHSNQAPADISELQPYLQAPATAAMLDRYKMIQSGELKWDQPAIAEKAAVDDQFDSLFKIGASGSWYASVIGTGDSGANTWGTFDPKPWVDDLLAAPSFSSTDDEPYEAALARVLAAFTAAHAGKEPAELTDFLPYVRTPEEQSALQHLLQNEKLEQEFQQTSSDYQKYAAPIRRALADYRAANHNGSPETPAGLDPYLKTPEDKEALQKMLQLKASK